LKEFELAHGYTYTCKSTFTEQILNPKKTRQCEDDLSPFTKSPDWELFVHRSFLW